MVVERVTNLRSVNVLRPEKPLLSVRREDEAELPVAGVVVAITLPLAFTARNVPAGVPRELIASEVVVAFVLVEFTAVKF